MLQWTLIAVSPLFFFFGMVLVEWRRGRAQGSIKQLRSEFAHESSPAAFGRRASSAGVLPGGSGFATHGSRVRRASIMGNLFAANGSGGASGPVLPVRARRKDAYEAFFDHNDRCLSRRHFRLMTQL